ncbi:PREDICTED: Ig-like V-type domain-containing protein FAM187A [Nanorana parkeri]|uniref:Ig-like V-type domain-containing protein FAM187A n=1 Tax=Nanorana parkeri TaxID=125878 RepID=UPI000854A153|nr:PREDICTED: Ig-like V-type domain-containing protein FAM187A [Nanorana parkeri]
MSGSKIVVALFILFCWQIPTAGGFVISEEEIKYSKVSCPAIPSFDTVAYATDMNIELPCLCMPDTKTPVIWYYKDTLRSLNTKLLTTPAGKADDYVSLHLESKIITRFYSLIVQKARVKDSGLYICGSSDGQFYWGYDVDIQDFSNAYVEFEDHHQHPQPNLVSDQLTAFTSFWEWSQCDRCDVRGEQQKVGLCYVSSTYLDLRYRLTETGVASCGSDAVPPNLKEQISWRRPEIFFRNCETPCHNRKAGVLGTIKYWLHKLNKIKDYIPWLPKAPTEQHTHTLGSSLTLACPGAKPQDAVSWDKGNINLYKSDYFIGQEMAKRIYIDHGNNLNFRYVTFNDKATYYCWLKGQLQAGIKLLITTDPIHQRKFTDAESYLALKIIAYSFCIFISIFVVVHCVKCFVYNFRCFPCI